MKPDDPVRLALRLPTHVVAAPGTHVRVPCSQAIGHASGPLHCRRIEWAAAWTVLSVFLVATGWVLSAFGALTQAGYLVACTLGAGALAAAWKRSSGSAPRFSPIRWRRFRRSLPLLFLALAALALLGGIIWPPNNYDALSYRTPRVLEWLAAGRWHWIHVNDLRFNDRACGFEWLTAPLLLFGRTDRWLFLINFLSYLLMPGLLFQVLTGLGVQRRVAWHWIWLVPSGYCFLMQAGSVCNDAFAAVYLLAAMRFALAARKDRRPGAIWLALLAAALLTGAKGTNLPLLLPAGLALWPALPALFRRPAASLFILLLAALVSFLPTAALNVKHCGDWSGAKLENKVFVISNPIAGVVGNTIQLAMANLQPPFFPLAQVYDGSKGRAWPGWIVRLFSHFEMNSFRPGELPNEEWAGLGFGVTALVLLSAGAAALRSRKPELRPQAAEAPPATPSLHRRLLLASPYLALLAYAARCGLSAAGRLVTPYYPLLLALPLQGPAQTFIVRQRWWKLASRLVFVLAIGVVIVTPARPLWPAVTILRALRAGHPDSALLARAERVYAIYIRRSDAFQPVRALLPPDEEVVGIVCEGPVPVTSLWKPLGRKRLVYILSEDSPAEARRRGVRYVVLCPNAVSSIFSMTPHQWADHFDAELMDAVEIQRHAALGPETWMLAKLR